MPPPADSEILTFVQGDSAQWSCSFDRYSGTAHWTLTVAFRGPSFLTVEAAAQPDGSFLVTLVPTDSAKLKPGAYVSVAVVNNVVTGQRHSLPERAFNVLPDPLAAPAKSHAETCLAMIEAQLEGRAVDGVESFTIDGQQITKMPTQQLYRLKALYRMEVNQERALARRRAGLGTGRTIKMHFGSSGRGSCERPHNRGDY